PAPDHPAAHPLADRRRAHVAAGHAVASILRSLERRRGAASEELPWPRPRRSKRSPSCVAPGSARVRCAKSCARTSCRASAPSRAGTPLFEGILGYDDSVVPAVENALLCGHDLIFLGERGQAKTRMIRQLTRLLDEWIPMVEGSEIHDDPFAPVSAFARALV